jgi:hypothetical protein
MPFLYLIFAFILGAAVMLSCFYFLPRLLDRLFNNGKKRVFKIIFRIDYYQQPSLFSAETRGALIKSPPIAVKIAARDRDDALHMLEDIIKDETKCELVSIKELRSNPENIENLKEKPKPGVIRAVKKA